MKLTIGLLATLVLASTSVLGCSEEDVSSTEIKTGGIAATIRVDAFTATSSTVKTTLQVGGTDGTYVELEGGDSLIAKAGTEEKTMSRVDKGRYEANIATGAGGTQFTVMLQRPDDDSAVDSTGTLPEPFDISEVPTTTPSRATDPIAIKWSNGGVGSMEIEVDGKCIFTETFTPASGSTEYTIPAGTLKTVGTAEGDEQTCDLTVTISRRTGGSSDPKLDPESSFILRQARAAAFVSAP